MRQRLSVFAAFLFVGACAERPSLQLGQTMEGALDSTDQVSTEGPYEDRWTFDLRAGQRVRIEMRSSDLDSYLKLQGPDGQLMATNDDALGRDAAITVRARAAGRHTVLATSYGREKTRGAYRISLVEIGEFADPGAIATIAAGQSKEGVLEVGDSTTEAGGYADHFDFRPTVPARSSSTSPPRRSTRISSCATRSASSSRRTTTAARTATRG